MNKKIIVFMLEYTRVDGWGAISNFITKFSENIKMNRSDVKIASSHTTKEIGAKNNFSLVKDAEYNREKFKKIRKPEKIYDAGEEYDYVFLISVQYGRLQDVVDLQNLYLICNGCDTSRIIALIEGTSGEYHKTSQFFSFLTKNKDTIYESIFFKSDQIVHFQRKGIGTLTRFLPLIRIDEFSDDFLRKSVREVLGDETVSRHLVGMKDNVKNGGILAGALKKLSQNCDKFKQCDVEQCAVYLEGTEVLSFLLFCFLLDGKIEGFSDFSEFCMELQKITIWTNGCIQLIENIVFHSSKRQGAFSFRVLDGENAYIRHKYALEGEHAEWLELMITDYPGCSHTYNIAEKFQDNLIEGEMKSRFQGLTPRDFFENDEKEQIRTAWREYYSEKGNVVNHYGIKIFHKAVQDSKGYFIAQSHSTHESKKGELYCDGPHVEEVSGLCMPGTSYSILLPMEMGLQKEDYIDYGIEDCKSKLDDEDRIFDYRIISKKLSFAYSIPSSKEKANVIGSLAKELHSADGQRQVICIDAGLFPGNRAEVVYKSIVLAMVQCDILFHVVLYGCRQEFVQMFLDASYLGWKNQRKELGYSTGRQIALYTVEKYEEILVLPEDWAETLRINRANSFSRETRWTDYFEKWQQETVEDSASRKVIKYPFDILVEESPGNTVFEKYVETVVNRNIQSQELGCKIQDTHMRLGSTIHVNHFYEAEILFGNSFFVERFALLMVRRMLNPLQEGILPVQESDKLTLYGYSNYSEQTVFTTIQFLRRIFPKIDVDYAILEREAEDRGFTHVDRIRYSNFFCEGEEGEKQRKEYFKNRKIICVIPIASTLKTNEKMINLFAEENGKDSRNTFRQNFELILVGSAKENEYWEKKDKNIIGKKGLGIFPSPEFFVEVALEYMEPLKCSMCFPDRIIDEKPLIEVNAASTIPNQAFGLLKAQSSPSDIVEQRIRDEEDMMDVLKDIMLYRHLERNENHFLFYFQTEKLMVQHPGKIREWLEGIRDNLSLSSSAGDYVILFCPAHFSNAGFIEYVNSYVFGSAAVVIRDDVDKEYRCNFRTKYSNLRRFVEKVKRYQSGGKGLSRRVRIFYVDDAIVTGHTFRRAQSLAQSIMKDYVLSDRQKFAVFDGIFVLIDRNSVSSRWQYTGVNGEEHFYAFRTVHISSIRNHGDACVYCNLAREAEMLKRSSVTREMEEYWESEEEKFSVRPLTKCLRQKDKDRAFRRLVCTNNAMIFLKEQYHGNQKENVLRQLLVLTEKGSKMHERQETEYFLSYCKVLSRPFRVFDKAVKEAVFDFLLVACWCALSGESYEYAINNSMEKPYLKKTETKKAFLEIERFINHFFVTESKRKDLIKVLLKQLTEMKSNFILREVNMDQILLYADKLEKKEKKDFIQYYKYLLKKRTGISSDTSKCLWLDRILINKAEICDSETLQEIYLENVWIYQDAFQKLNERVKISGFQDVLSYKDLEQKEKVIYFETEYLNEYITPYQFKDFINLLSLYGMADGDGKLTEDGIIFVVSNYLLYRFISQEFVTGSEKINSTEEGNLEKVDYIATCMKYIMQAKDVVIMMEFDAEYDMWENELIERYNAIVSDMAYGQKIMCPSRKEYLVLGSSEGKSGGWTIREKEVIKIAQDSYNKKNLTEKGYSFNLKERIFSWELGHTTEYPVYIFARWEKSEQEDMAGISVLNQIRSVLQYYWMLNVSVFNKGNESFFYEIARQKKQNAIHSRQKAHTHTKSDIRMEQYNHMLVAGKYKGYYQSDLLMLLADLNVSEHYRKSLSKEYYLSGVSFRPGRWDSKLSLFENIENYYVVNSDMTQATRLIVSYDVLFDGDTPLQKNEEIVAIDCTNAERETFLLIYSLMINAVTEGRGYMENECVTVYCTKTPDGRLRIANRVGKGAGKKTPEQIMEELKYPSEEENQGISLWSMSRYIKRMIASILDERLRELEKQRRNVTVEMLEEFKIKIKRMLSAEFQISVRNEEVEGKRYFSVLIPIFAEKFHKI